MRAPLEPSPTLATDERIRRLISAGRPIIHLAFGEAGLPVHPVLREVLDAASGSNSYGPVAGNLEARAAAAGYFARRGLPTNPESIVFAPGSKGLLFALLLALQGDLLLPQPSWVSYAAQAAIVDKRVIRLPIPSSAGGLPDPESLIEWATANHHRKAILLLTIPDNPTGTAVGRDLLQVVCETAERHKWWIVSDEIYRELAFDQEGFTSPAHFLPDQTVITTGLSKSLALGGWRIGFARFPDSLEGRELRARVIAIASELWSALAAPMQRLAGYALQEPQEVQEFITSGRRLHASVIRALHRIFASHELDARPPSGGFYLYADFERRRTHLARIGISTSPSLADRLLEEYDVAVLPGSSFGDDPEHLAVRVAGSLLYGETDEQRWAALAAEDPLTLPWISEKLARVDAALGRLLSVA